MRSGNVVFESKLSQAKVKAAMEEALGVSVFVRDAEEMAAILKANPFPNAAPNWTVVIFLDSAPPMHPLQARRTRKSG